MTPVIIPLKKPNDWFTTIYLPIVTWNRTVDALDMKNGGVMRRLLVETADSVVGAALVGALIVGCAALWPVAVERWL